MWRPEWLNGRNRSIGHPLGELAEWKRRADILELRIDDLDQRLSALERWRTMDLDTWDDKC